MLRLGRQGRWRHGTSNGSGLLFREINLLLFLQRGLAQNVEASPQIKNLSSGSDERARRGNRVKVRGPGHQVQALKVPVARRNCLHTGSKRRESFLHMTNLVRNKKRTTALLTKRSESSLPAAFRERTSGALTRASFTTAVSL
jgi:hypothetical protein